MSRARSLVTAASGVVVLLIVVVAAVKVTTRDDRHRAEAGWVLRGGYAVAGENEGRTTRVDVPWGSVGITVGEPRDEADLGNLLAPERGSLVWVSVEPDPTMRPLPRTLTGRVFLPEVALVADGRTYPVIAAEPDGVSAGRSLLRGTSAWVALASHPDEVSVQVTYDGRSQTMGPDGEVEAGSFAALADVRTAYSARECGGARLSPGFATAGRYGREGRATCSVEWFGQVPYVAGLGWAEEGRTWLVASVASAPAWGVVRTGDGADTTNISTRGSRRSFTLDGREPRLVVPVNEVPGLSAMGVDDPDVVVFETPAGEPSGTLRVSHVASVVETDLDVEADGVTFRWAVDTASL